ncbi:MAG: oxygen-independent coproporphyrinogen III oxidase [Bacteroidetes bacterium]|nr:oxygen-independent coproporphyrinogen III oxidase [Bacteroidota bacterium]
MNSKLQDKYTVPGPRYTSYPTVPYWDEEKPDESSWISRAKQTFHLSNNTEGISLYIHLPFCESLCTYCGCNTRITRNHLVEMPYIMHLIDEWCMYLDLFGESPRISEIHLGGGTPTFFSAVNLDVLLTSIISSASLTADARLSFEGHPGNTSREHLQTLYDLGFKRLSFGIQDFDLKVQDAIHRFQTVEEVRNVTELAREIGYTSVNYDLVYGLPFQTEAGILNTIHEVIGLRPDRIAFYSYAHVPWVKPGQRKFTEMDLPEANLKRKMYELGRNMFEDAGYSEVGMDHFALPGDELLIAAKQGKLHRNFMGYTAGKTSLLIGLGASSISDCGTAYVQNPKHVEDYYAAVKTGHFPFVKGHLLNHEDLILRGHITKLMCNFSTSWKNPEQQCEALFEGIEKLDELENDGLLIRKPYSLEVLPPGRNFIRNICMALDARLRRKKPQTQIFSSTA